MKIVRDEIQVTNWLLDSMSESKDRAHEKQL